MLAMSARPTLADLIALAERQAPSRPPPGAEFAVPQELDDHAYYIMGPDRYSAAVSRILTHIDVLPVALRALVYETGKWRSIAEAWARGDSEAHIIEFFLRTYNAGGYRAEAKETTKLERTRSSNDRNLLKAARRARARRLSHPSSRRP